MYRWTVHLKGTKGISDIHAVVAVGQKVYFFGGYDPPKKWNRFMDQIHVHVFNTEALCWMLPTVTTGRAPSLRYHTTVLIEDTVHIWGGFTEKGDFCDVLYAFGVDTHRWFKPDVSGTVPEARCGHSACVLGKVMYIFGGVKPTGCTNDIYKLDTATMVWSLINTGGTPAPASGCHSATIVGAKMFVFGGQGDQDDDHYNNISVFDTETNHWLSTPSPRILPQGREGHSAIVYNGEMYIFGGDNYHGSLNDLWKFNPETSWKKLKHRGKRLSWRSGICCCVVGDRIIFGGCRPHLYILDLAPSLKTLCKLSVIKYGLEQSDLPHDIRWELASMTTNRKRRRGTN